MNTISSLLKFLGNTLGANPTTTLTTTSKTLVGAINEVDADIAAVADYVVEQGTNGIWTYRKWESGLYDAWYIGSVDLLAGTAWGSGFYYHRTSSVITPPSFSLSVVSLVGTPRSAQLAMFCGSATDYSQYWATASAGTGTIPVRLDMQGTWK